MINQLVYITKPTAEHSASVYALCNGPNQYDCLWQVKMSAYDIFIALITQLTANPEAQSELSGP